MNCHSTLWSCTSTKVADETSLSSRVSRPSDSRRSHGAAPSRMISDRVYGRRCEAVLRRVEMRSSKPRCRFGARVWVGDALGCRVTR